ncbi:hypothetical protein ABK040_015353 [Willaertia magna]
MRREGRYNLDEEIERYNTSDSEEDKENIKYNNFFNSPKGRNVSKIISEWRNKRNKEQQHEDSPNSNNIHYMEDHHRLDLFKEDRSKHDDTIHTSPARKEFDNSWQSFLASREKIPKSKIREEEDSFTSSNRFLSEISTSLSNKLNFDDSFINESESFIQEMKGVEIMAKDPSTLGQRKSTITKLHQDFKSFKLQKSNSDKISTNKQISTRSNFKDYKRENIEPEEKKPSTKSNTKSNNISKQIKAAETKYNTNNEPSFKKQLEERIRLRNETHRLNQMKKPVEKTTEHTNCFEPNDLRKLIASVNRKYNGKENELYGVESTKSFTLSSLIEDEVDKKNLKKQQMFTKSPLTKYEEDSSQPHSPLYINFDPVRSVLNNKPYQLGKSLIDDPFSRLKIKKDVKENKIMERPKSANKKTRVTEEKEKLKPTRSLSLSKKTITNTSLKKNSIQSNNTFSSLNKSSKATKEVELKLSDLLSQKPLTSSTSKKAEADDFFEAKALMQRISLLKTLREKQ